MARIDARSAEKPPEQRMTSGTEYPWGKGKTQVPITVGKDGRLFWAHSRVGKGVASGARQTGDNMTNSTRTTDRAFLKLIDELTERGIITWRREENELRANLELVLEVQDCAENEGDPYSDRLRDLIIYGVGTELYSIEPVPFELLTDQGFAPNPVEK